MGNRYQLCHTCKQYHYEDDGCLKDRIQELETEIEQIKHVGGINSALVDILKEFKNDGGCWCEPGAKGSYGHTERCQKVKGILGA